MSPRTILDQQRILDKIIEKEIQSVVDSREVVFTMCGNGRVHEHPYIGKWNKISAVPYFNPEKTCNGKKSFLFHTHVVSSAVPSLTDVRSYGKEFDRHASLKMGCSVGVDGIFCIGKNGKVITKEFTEEQEKHLLEASGIKKWRGEKVFCDKLVQGKETLHACSIQSFGKGEKTMGIFKEVSLHGGSSWSGDELSDVSLYSPLPSMQVECYGSDGGQKQLTCIAREKDVR